jgi:hypothetical protein
VRLAAGVSEPAFACIEELALAAVELGDLSPELLAFSFTFTFSFSSFASTSFVGLGRGRRLLLGSGRELLQLFLELHSLLLAVGQFCRSSWIGFWTQIL